LAEPIPIWPLEPTVNVVQLSCPKGNVKGSVICWDELRVLSVNSVPVDEMEVNDELYVLNE
jgi:hypothetical protein